ncbi:MAG: GGDEF domain-containing protein [Smithella sp.]
MTFERYKTNERVVHDLYMGLITYRGNREYCNALENEYLVEIKSQEMARLSNTDVLTGLYNRRYFDNEFDRELKRSGRSNSMLSIIMLDIDHFKKINDSFGHQVGDEYLKKTAATLTSVFKRDSNIVARYGGEEFVVLLPGINADHARQLAEDVQYKI